MKIVVIGSGGREHAIAWMLSKSSDVSEIICIPGNGGTQIESKCKNIDVNSCPYTEGLDFSSAVTKIVQTEQCQMVVVGPENPLADGIADSLWEQGIPVVGPKKQGAELEASKDVAKQFMQKYNVACAESATFTDIDEANAYIKKHGAPIVIKADGLAAGKGVVVASSEDEALRAIHEFMGNRSLGNAGQKVVIEEYLQGTEISILAAVSVTDQSVQNGSACIIPFVPARDHKRLLDGAKGPNTGGMGAIAPLADVTDEQMSLFQSSILEPTLKGLIAEKMDYRGFIFFGVMLTSKGPKLLEYNVRLGDPETQAVLPLMDFDFAEMCKSIVDGSLKNFVFKWKKGFVCAPVAVSQGYPGIYKKGCLISINTDVMNKTGAKLFVAGARIERRQRNELVKMTFEPEKKENNNSKSLVTSGGRVFALSAYGESLEQAQKNAYDAMNSVSFFGMFYRKDIGLPGAASSGDL